MLISHSLNFLKKAQQTKNNNQEIYNTCQRSILYFVKHFYGLSPQRVKAEYADSIFQCDLAAIQQSWFEPFVKGKNITWQQYVYFLSIERAINGVGKKRIAIESGMGTGKSAALAITIIWFLFCFKNAQIPCTAPTSSQMHDVLWKEISLWLEKLPPELKKLYDWSTEYLRMKESPQTWFARARTAAKDRPEALAGIHAPFILALADEASGVPDEVFTIGEGVLAAENALVILVSQHTRLIGYFHECFNSDREAWQTLRFNSEQSPIVDKQFIERIEQKYTRDSDEWKVQVQGQPPKSDAVDDKGYVPLLNSTDLTIVPTMAFVNRKRLGIDPAGEGINKTQWVLRDTFSAQIILSENISTPKSIAQKTLTLMQEYDINPEDVYIDNFGAGANVAVELAIAGKRVNGVNVGDKAEDDTRYINRRAEVYWRLREWVKHGGALVKHDEWEQLLLIRYQANLKGKLKIMSKEDMRKLGIPSPDAADALSLTFWEEDRKMIVRSHMNDTDNPDPFSVV